MPICACSYPIFFLRRNAQSPLLKYNDSLPQSLPPSLSLSSTLLPDDTPHTPDDRRNPTKPKLIKELCPLILYCENPTTRVVTTHRGPEPPPFSTRVSERHRPPGAKDYYSLADVGRSNRRKTKTNGSRHLRTLSQLPGISRSTSDSVLGDLLTYLGISPTFFDPVLTYLACIITHDADTTFGLGPRDRATRCKPPLLWTPPPLKHNVTKRDSHPYSSPVTILLRYTPDNFGDHCSTF